MLDSCAMIAYLRGENGALAVQNLLVDTQADCVAYSINLCEVYYQSVRQSGKSHAVQILNSLRADGVLERSDMSKAFWERVGDLKARGRIALPDCFCIALAQELGGEVVTSDHGEFDAIAPLGIVPITFIR